MISEVKQQNGTAAKIEKNKLVESDFVLQNGNVIFKKIQTMSDIPAGEYYPAEDRGTGYLLPINRSATYAEGKPLLDIELNTYSDNDLQELLENNSKAEGQGLNFVPVHKYFPIEKWNPGLLSADENIQRFLKSKDLYRNLQMDYRRSLLIHGDPGTGKSQYLFHLSKQLIDNHDAIVIRIENSRQLSDFENGILNKIAGRTNRLKVIIIEELADFTGSRNITSILHLLDNMHFRENVMFLLTTNYPERIPENVVDRPSRIDLLSGVYSKDYTAEFVDAWYEFILGEPISEKEKEQSWYKEVPGKLSPAYMKELFIYSQLLEVSINKAWKLIKERKQSIKANFAESSEKSIGFSINEFEEL